MKRIYFQGMIIILITFQTNLILGYEIKQTVKELVARSQSIIIGEVIDVSPKIEKDGHREVVCTYVRVKIFTDIKNNIPESTLTMRMLGGRVDGRGMWSENYYPFDKNQQVLLFLKKNNKKNIYEISEYSGKLVYTRIDGIDYFDGSMLKNDGIVKLKNKSLVKKSELIKRIEEYLNEGGK